MIGIIKKDLYITRFQALIFVLCSFAYIGTYLFIKEIIFESKIEDTAFSRTMLSVLPLILVMEFNCKSFQADNGGKPSEKFFRTLPVTPYKMVLARFISSIIFSTYGLIVSAIGLSIFTKTDNLALHLKDYKTIFLIYLVVLMIVAMQMPILIYNGNELLSLLLPMVVITLPFTIVLALNHFDMNLIIQKVSNFMKSHKTFSDNLPLIGLGATALVCALFSALSTTIYKRREF